MVKSKSYFFHHCRNVVIFVNGESSFELSFSARWIGGNFGAQKSQNSVDICGVIKSCQSRLMEGIFSSFALENLGHTTVGDASTDNVFFFSAAICTMPCFQHGFFHEMVRRTGIGWAITSPKRREFSRVNIATTYRGIIGFTKTTVADYQFG